MVLECIEWFIDEYGYSPTYRELGNLLNMDTASVFRRALILIDKGYLTQEYGKQRTLRVIKHAECE